jgi:hypothetical protein
MDPKISVTFGRSTSCDFKISSSVLPMAISRVQATLAFEDGYWFLYNGTKGNPATNPIIDTDGRLIREKTKVVLGNYILHPEEENQIILRFVESPLTDSQKLDTEFLDTQSPGIEGELETLIRSVTIVTEELRNIKKVLNIQDAQNKNQNKYLILLAVGLGTMVCILVFSTDFGKLEKGITILGTITTISISIFAALNTPKK